jgi:hypothetical protein
MEHYRRALFKKENIMIQNFLDQKELNSLHMRDSDKRRLGIFQSSSSYGKFSSVTYYDKASQYCAFQLCQTTCKIDLRQFNMQIEGYSLRVDNNYVDVSFPDLLLLQLNQIMKRKQLQKQKSPHTVIVPVSEPITMDEKSVRGDL